MAMIWAIVFCFPVPGQTPSNTNIGWQMYNGNYSGDRFSPLKQITRENVAHRTGRSVRTSGEDV
jgi:hypothetical protein